MNNRIFDDRRIYKRVDLNNPVHFQLKDPKQFGSCLSCDISEGGMRMMINKFVPLGTEIAINVKLATEKVIECFGKVVWVKQLPFMDRYQAGLEFMDFGSIYDSRNEIGRYVHTEN